MLYKSISFWLFVLGLGLYPLEFRAQSADLSRDYVPLVSVGKLPDDFIKSASQKARKDVETILKKGGKNAKQKAGFIVTSNFALDNLLKSGKILYGDPISAYVNSVAKKILKDDPDLKEKIRIYVARSSVVNAYAFENGVIIINIGLIARLQNEAQLAFILCHEISHVTKKHAITAHLEYLKSGSKKKSYNRKGTDMILAKSRFSQKQETEADVSGLDMFLKTDYSFTEIDSVFSILHYSYLPEYQEEFDRKHLNEKSLQLPNEYYLDRVNKVYLDEHYDDEKHTHPNIGKRKAEMKKKIGGRDNSGRKLFIVSQSDFESSRELARFENIRLYFQDLMYPEAAYCSFVLMKKYPHNMYLREMMARSLFQIAVYKSMAENIHYVVNYTGRKTTYYKKREPSYVDAVLDCSDTVQGPAQQLYFMLDHLTPREALVLALHNNWKLAQYQGYNDPYTMNVCDTLMFILAYRYKMKTSSFLSTPLPYKEDSSAYAKLTPKEETKKDKKAVKKKPTTSSKNKKKDPPKEEKPKPKPKKKRNKEHDLVKYGFAEILQDPQFKERFARAEMNAKSRKDDEENQEEEWKKKQKGRKKKSGGATSKEQLEVGDSVMINYAEIQHVISKSGEEVYNLLDFKMLGIDRVVVVDPFYMKIDSRKQDAVQYGAAEIKLKEYIQLLQDNGTKAGVDVTVLSPYELTENDVSQYNDLSLINDWIIERINHGSLQQTLILNREYKEQLIQKYGTEYFMWTGAVSIRHKKQILLPILVSLYIPMIPFTTLYLLSPSYTTYYYAVMYNINTGKVELLVEHEVGAKDTKNNLNFLIYDTMYQISKTAKK